MEEIYDPLEDVMVQYLPVEDILNFCETEKRWRKLCESEETWKFLLERDFGVARKENTRLHYEANYRIKKWKDQVWEIMKEIDTLVDPETHGIKTEFENREAELCQEGFLSLIQLCKWNLGEISDVKVDLFKPDFQNSSYMFLRRFISLYYCLEHSLVSCQGYPLYKQLEVFPMIPQEYDQIIVRDMTNSSIFEQLRLKRRYKYSLWDIMQYLDNIRQSDFTTGLELEMALQNYRDNPSDDILLQNIDLGPPLLDF